LLTSEVGKILQPAASLIIWKAIEMSLLLKVICGIIGFVSSKFFAGGAFVSLEELNGSKAMELASSATTKDDTSNRSARKITMFL